MPSITFLKPAALLAATAFALVAPAMADENSSDADAMMQAWQEAMTPGSEHALLAEMAGTWKTTMTIEDPEGGAPEIVTGTAERAMDLDGRVLVERLSSEMMGMPYNGVGVSGYDTVTGRYWGTWTDSMSTGVTLLWGQMDETGGVLEGEYSEPISGTRAPMRIEFVMDGPDREVDTFYMPGPNGELAKTIEMVYERQ